MKPFLVLTLLACLICSSCSTLANRRDLYRPLKAQKPSTAKAKNSTPSAAPTSPNQ